jgi:RimJ/RimL family protein N-acetyltransferase
MSGKKETVFVQKAKLEDYEDYLEIRSEKKNLFWTGYSNPPDYEKFKLWFNERINNPKRDIYLMYTNDGCLGSLHLDIYDEYIAIGYSIKEKYEGRGYASKLVKEAINICNLIKLQNRDIKLIIAWINQHNFASIKVAEKNGFKKSENTQLKMRFGNKEMFYKYTLKL